MEQSEVEYSGKVEQSTAEQRDRLDWSGAEQNRVEESKVEQSSEVD